jgi:hypothetical protein
MKYWEIIADNLSKAGSWGCMSAIDSNGRTIWIADAHRGDGKRFVVRADEKLTAFLELESAIRACDELTTPASVANRLTRKVLVRHGPRQEDLTLSQKRVFLMQDVLMSVEASRHRCKRLLAEGKVVLPVLKMHDHNEAVFFHSFGIEAQARICFGPEVSRDNKPGRS